MCFYRRVVIPATWHPIPTTRPLPGRQCVKPHDAYGMQTAKASTCKVAPPSEYLQAPEGPLPSPHLAPLPVEAATQTAAEHSAQSSHLRWGPPPPAGTRSPGCASGVPLLVCLPRALRGALGATLIPVAPGTGCGVRRGGGTVARS